MGITKLIRMSLKQHIYETLRMEIEQGQYEPGQRLPPIRVLSQRFDTSSFTISSALEMLEQDGYVERRNGVGAFACERSTMSPGQTIALCMRSQGHLYADLAMRLSAGMQEAGLLPIVLDLTAPGGEERIRELARAGTTLFLVQGEGGAEARALFGAPTFSGKHIIGFLRWEGPRLPGQHLVLSDTEQGGRLVAHHLRDQGHSHVLVVAGGPHHTSMPQLAGPHEDPPRDCRNQGTCFLEEWERLGGRATVLMGHLDRTERPSFAEGELLAPWSAGNTAPTALVGTMDTFAAEARDALRRHRPEIARALPCFGFFNTPWSESGDFSSVDLDLPGLVEAACRVVDRLQQNPEAEPTTTLIQPRLVLRETGAPQEALP